MCFLLQYIQVFTISFRKSDEGLFVSDQENVGLPGWERFAISVLEVHNTDTSEMLLDVKDLSNSSYVVASGNVGKVSRLVLHPFDNLTLFKIVFDGVSLVDFGMRESNGSCVVGNNVWDFVWSNSFFADLEQLEFGFNFFYFNESESSFNIEKNSVMFVSFWDRKSIHDANWELDWSSYFIINLYADFLILDNDVCFTSVKG